MPSSTTVTDQAPAPTGRATRLAPGVHAYLQPPGGWCLNNVGILVSDGQSALVDTTATHTRARHLRATALALNPAAPPRTVVNTHFHGDHAFGNHLFPEALVIGHEHARTQMIAAGLHLTGLWPDVDWGPLELAPPQLTYTDRVRLHIGAITAELEHIGPAHTAGDSVVWLPEHKVLFTGDLVMNQVTPFCLMGSITGSLTALERLRAYHATTIVPGHGPLAGPEVLDQTQGYLRLVQQLAKDGHRSGLTPLETARRADLGPYTHLIDSERLVPNLHRAYAELDGATADDPLPPDALNTALTEMIAFHGRLPCCLA